VGLKTRPCSSTRVGPLSLIIMGKGGFKLFFFILNFWPRIYYFSHFDTVNSKKYKVRTLLLEYNICALNTNFTGSSLESCCNKMKLLIAVGTKYILDNGFLLIHNSPPLRISILVPRHDMCVLVALYSFVFKIPRI
jgi:hypothetical protein